MCNLTFEGDFKDISTRQLEFIRNTIEDRGLKNGTIHVEVVGKAGDNYVANVKRIFVDDNGKALKMIAKLAPNNKTIPEIGNIATFFQNEHNMYSNVLPKYTEIQIAAKIPESKMFKYAKCYGTFAEAPNEVILLEDLQETGFVMMDKIQSFNDDTVKLVLKNFAILHSLSFVLKQQEPEMFATIKRNQVNVWLFLLEQSQMKSHFEKQENYILSILDDDKYKSKVEGSMARLRDCFLDTENIVSCSQNSVIQHGDPWTNNIMFRLENGKIIECCMIDYQVSTASSPAADIQYMIFNCTNHETRSKHYHDWISYYHSELENSLGQYKLQADLIFPRDQLNAELEMQSKVSFGQSLILAGVMIVESADIGKAKVAMEGDNSLVDVMDLKKISNHDAVTRYKKRIEGLVDSFVELGYL